MSEALGSPPLRLAIVGAGLQGHRRAEAVHAIPSIQLTVVASNSPRDASAFAEEYGARLEGHWAQAVEANDVDAVLVCTPPDSHLDIVQGALAAGKHVLCEKPMARTSAEATAMVQAGARAGLVVACGFNHRYHPAVARLRELLTDGTLGQSYHLRCAYGIAGRPGYEREWRADPKVVSGGHLMEQGIHALDLTQWLLGDVTELTAVCATHYWPIAPLEDNAAVLLRFKSGATAEIHSSLTQWVNLFRLELTCERGLAAAEGLGGGYGDEQLTVWRRTQGPFTAERIAFRGADQSWRRELEDFEASIRQGEVARMPHPGITALRMVERAYEANRAGTWEML